jgi:membrane-associated phospholipid phosphatase
MKLSRASLALGVVFGIAARTGPACAQAAPEHERSGRYYAVHGGIAAALVAGSVTTQLLFHPSTGADFDWFPGDVGLRGVRSAAAAELSNVFITMSLTAPVFTQLGRGVDAHFGNFGVVYGEALAGNLLLNGVVKLAARRRRPYTYGLRESEDVQSRDRNVSFYSGHSSTAFTAAVAGSLLYAESTPDRAGRLVVWSSQLAFASATANLRVRAGKHYYSDVVVGALIGTGLGVLVPTLHGGDYAPEGVEYLAAGGGLLLGVVASQLLPLRSDAPRGGAKASWSIAPWASPGGAGVGARGAF